MSSDFEAQAVVADVGSFSTRIGFAGNDTPQSNIPTAIGKIQSGSSAASSSSSSKSSSSSRGTPSGDSWDFDLSRFQEDMSVEHPVQDGLVQDWDAYQMLWEHAIKNYIKVDLHDTPLLVAEKPYVSPADRIKLCELMFETFKVPALFLSKDSVLECYACGRMSALVVDIGASGTTVSSVVDGWVETKAMGRSAVGGRVMDARVLEMLQRRIASAATGGKSGSGGSNSSSKSSSSSSGIMHSATALLPLFRLHKTAMGGSSVASLQNVHPTYDAFMRLEMARDLKESLCRMSDTPTSDNDQRYVAIPTLPYELPDGTVVDIGAERFEVPELLCDPSSVDADNADLAALGWAPNRPSALPMAQCGLPKLVADSIARCDFDAQHTMAGNIVVAGGGSCYDGLPERLKSDVEHLVRTHYPSWRIKTVSPAINERALCAWLGGSILASLGSFHELWMTKAEYHEFGAALVEKKCP